MQLSDDATKAPPVGTPWPGVSNATALLVAWERTLPLAVQEALASPNVTKSRSARLDFSMGIKLNVSWTKQYIYSL